MGFQVLQQMRQVRIAEMERAARRTEAAPPSSAHCDRVLFAELRSRLKVRGVGVVCGLMLSEQCAVSVFLPRCFLPTSD